jgi:isopentenyl-diphosphate delta-isomerase
MLDILKEEMGFDCELTEKFSFLYKAQFENGLTEHELDFIFIGEFNDKPNINSEEVKDFAWMLIDDVLSDLKQFPNKYTEWFKIILNQYVSHL